MITAWVIALLSLTAAVLVAVGLARAWLGRRRPQVVIHDVELDEGVPAEAAAGLSPQLREKVRRELRLHISDATHAEMETVEKDLAAGLVTVRGGAVRMTAVPELDRTTSDSMTALSAGLRAVAPSEGEGLAVALDLALPAQRGWSVRSSPTIRGYGAKAKVGLSVEVARLGRAPDAVTTFWETSDALHSRETTRRGWPPRVSSCTSCCARRRCGSRSSLWPGTLSRHLTVRRCRWSGGAPGS